MTLPTCTTITKGMSLRVKTIDHSTRGAANNGDLACQEYVDLIGTVVVTTEPREIRGRDTIIHCKGQQRGNGTYTYSLYAFELALPSVDWWDVWMKEE